MARANLEAANQLAAAIAPWKFTSREVGALYQGWQTGTARTRELILASPQIYMQAQSFPEARAAVCGTALAQ